MAHPVMQWQIITPHPDRAAAFYGGLFGWEINQNNMLNYRMVDTGSELGINGGIWPAPPEAPSFVQLFIQVEDVKGFVEKAVAQGAKVLIAPQALPDGDTLAILQDPQGMSFGLMSSVTV